MNPSRAASRRLLLRRLIDEHEIHSQAELVRILARRGHRVTQTTVSRDLAALGIGKHNGSRGPSESYAVPGRAKPAQSDLLHRMLRQFVLAIEHSGNLVVLKTAPGSASPVASAIDHAKPSNVIGTVAGDDTVLVITRNIDGGANLARQLETILGG